MREQGDESREQGKNGEQREGEGSERHLAITQKEDRKEVEHCKRDCTSPLLRMSYDDIFARVRTNK